jgi:signal transduction histidine kinase
LSPKKQILAISILAIVLFTSFSGYAQSDGDSLDRLLTEYKTSTDKVNFLNETARKNSYADSSYAFLCLKKAISIGVSNKLYSHLGDSYRYYGNIYNYYGYGNQTRDSYTNSYEYYTLSNDSIGLAKITNNLGVYYYQWPNDYRKALLFLERSLELKKILKEGDTSIANTYFNLGHVHLLLNNYIKALKFFFKSLEIVEREEDYDKIIDNQNHIAQVYLGIGEYAKARKYLDLSMKLYTNVNETSELANTDLLYSNLYISENKLDSAIVKLKEAKKIYEEKEVLLGLGRVYNNYIKIYIKQERYDQVFIYANLAKDLFKKSGSIYDLSLTYNRLGVAYFKTNDLKKSREFLEKSLVTCLKYGFIEVSAKNYLYLAEIDYVEKKYKGAYTNFYKYSNARDSIFNLKKSRIASEIEDKYAINKKEIELELLSQEKEKVEIERDKNKTTSNYLMLIIILVLVVLTLLFYLYYSNRRLNETLEELVQERTKELKKTNRLLANSKKNEEDVSRIKSDLLRNISESLKSPISEIQSLVKILKGENEENDELYEQLELIASSTQRLNAIIKSITELYYIEEKKGKDIQNNKIEFDKLIYGIVDNYRGQAESRDLKITIESNGTVIFNHDVELVSNAVEHLLKTVVDYANKGHINVKVYQNENEKGIEMCSSDFNINKKIFNNDLSTNVDSDTNQIDRMFINLYVTKKMIDKMGGRIHWESVNNGEGIRFVMTFPNE